MQTFFAGPSDLSLSSMRMKRALEHMFEFTGAAKIWNLLLFQSILETKGLDSF